MVVHVGGLASLAVRMVSQARAVDMGWRPLMRVMRRVVVLKRRADGVVAHRAGAGTREETVASEHTEPMLSPTRRSRC